MKWSLAQSKRRVGGVVGATTRLSEALSGISHTTPTPAAVEAGNRTHYTYTCRALKTAHRAVEFYTETLMTD